MKENDSMQEAMKIGLSAFEQAAQKQYSEVPALAHIS
jgi:hypothetical protein